MRHNSNPQLLRQYAFAQGGEFTTAQANELLSCYYYHNGEHYVAEMLTRMVRNGQITRIKRGHYRLNMHNFKQQEETKNQLKLF